MPSTWHGCSAEVVEVICVISRQAEFVKEVASRESDREASDFIIGRFVLLPLDRRRSGDLHSIGYINGHGGVQQAVGLAVIDLEGERHKIVAVGVFRRGVGELSVIKISLTHRLGQFTNGRAIQRQCALDHPVTIHGQAGDLHVIEDVVVLIRVPEISVLKGVNSTFFSCYALVGGSHR